MSLHRILTAAAVVLTLIAGGVSLLPVSTRVTPMPVRLASLPDAAPGGVQADSLAEEVILANVFSASRTAPMRRYSPPEQFPAPEGAEGDSSMPVEPMPMAGMPQLTGTMVRQSGSLALLRLDPAARSPRLYRVGDREGVWRVLAITAREVTLDGPTGRVVLRLSTPERLP